MLLADKKVAIIGAGPVGLTLARLLQQQMVGYAQAAQRETSENEAALNHPSFSFKNRFSS